MYPQLSRRLLILGFSSASVLGSSACAQKKIERLAPPPESSSLTPSSTPEPGSNPSKWAHYGDSFTASGYPAKELSGLTGYTHISAGVSGDTSMAGAFRAGALELKVGFKDGLIPASEPALVTEMSTPSNPIAANAWHYPCSIMGVKGYLMRDRKAKDTYFYREFPGEDIQVESWNVVKLDPGTPTDVFTEGTRGRYSLIVGFGRNDIDTGVPGWQTVQNIQDILNTNTTPGARQFVWDVPPWTTDPSGSKSRESVDELNSLLAQEFGEIFIRPIDWILQNPEEAFSVARASITEQDEVDISNGVLPKSFRADDIGHMNDIGARAWAHFVYQEIKKRGW